MLVCTWYIVTNIASTADVQSEKTTRYFILVPGNYE